jgi:hypothetical protein
MSRPDSSSGQWPGYATLAAALIAALASLAGVFVEPTVSAKELFNLVARRDAVSIVSPRPGQGLAHLTSVRGRGRKASDHDLYIFVRSPDELKYYLVTPQPVAIDKEGNWRVDNIVIGSNDPRERKREVGDVYRITAVIVDGEGISEIGRILTTPGDPFLLQLPHQIKQANIEGPLI